MLRHGKELAQALDVALAPRLDHLELATIDHLKQTIHRLSISNGQM
jgi:hypothetical protein